MRKKLNSNSRTRLMIASFSSLTLAITVGCSEPPVPQVQQVVLYDIAAKQPVIAAPVSEYPAAHPATGKKTLMPAMYCEKCGAWRQVPLPEQLNRMATAIPCSKCKGPLAIEGPMPE